MCFFSLLVKLHRTSALEVAAEDLTGNCNRNGVFYYCYDDDKDNDNCEEDVEEEDRLCRCRYCCCYLARRGLSLFFVSYALDLWLCEAPSRCLGGMITFTSTK